ncbi:J domain-containing protein [Kaistia sp. MMO-174]|uniref:J domain-containing protein n=1 Tax=Kaistia sp. MMO-174 TaxID=3081256 RepID=UPI0030186BF7
MTAAAFPLAWPAGFPRRTTREKGAFRTSLSGALDNVRKSIEGFARDSGKRVDGITLSSNVTLGVSKPADPGVAVWFVWDGMQVCIPVDRYSTVEANIQAIHHIVEARRVELRHGTLALVRASLRGFIAPPPGSEPRQRHWQDVLDLTSPSVTTGDVESRFKALSKQRHPDMPGGSNEAMAELNRARDEALKELGNGRG